MCYERGWEGDEGLLVEKLGNLVFHHYVAVNTKMVEVTRTDHHCPRCGNVLKSHRLVGGMVLDQ